MKDFYEEIIPILKGKPLDKDRLNRLKVELAGKHGLKKIPTNADILMHASPADHKCLNLVTKPTRTLSGVAPIAMMTKPFRCPHGTCIYCPGGIGSIFGDVPQSYTGKEPSTMRSIRNNYDPYLIVFNRLEQYVVLNQNPEKTEIIIQGGTFPAMDRDYKRTYMSYVYKALNDFSDMFYKDGELDFGKFKNFFELPGDVEDNHRTLRVQKKILKHKGSAVLVEEQLKNEHSKIRCVGLTIETKPDWGLLDHGNEMLEFGCTRVELGVQATDDDILKFVNRGHSLKDTIESTRILKDLGFKINYHMMPGLPLSDPQKDLNMLKRTLEDEDFRPDMYKIYPTMVMRGTALEKLWKKGTYKPISLDVAADIISEFKRYIPRWIRIMRVQRDIPTFMSEAGVEKTNLRQYIDKKLKEKGIICNCIRCREAGLASRTESLDSAKPAIFIEEYKASGGTEFFISAEDKERKHLFGYCRLRFPSQQLRPEFTPATAMIRELHVVGNAAGIGEEGDIQHRGLGKKLLNKAEAIAIDEGYDKMLVISGIGVKEYYKKQGYSREGPYMSKRLS